MEQYKYMTSLLTFYLKGEINIDNNEVEFKNPNTILKFIPLGCRRETIPIGHIVSAGSSFHLRLKTMIGGIIFTVLSFVLFSESFILGLILLLVGANMVISSLTTIIEVRDTSSVSHLIGALIFDKKKMEDAVGCINRMTHMRTTDTNVRMQTDRTVEVQEKMLDALNDMRQN